MRNAIVTPMTLHCKAWTKTMRKTERGGSRNLSRELLTEYDEHLDSEALEEGELWPSLDDLESLQDDPRDTFNCGLELHTFGELEAILSQREGL